jgi:hypothetical protein
MSQSKVRRLERVTGTTEYEELVELIERKEGRPRKRRPPRRTRSDFRTRKNWQPTFLKCLRINGCVSHACLAAGIDRASVYQARQRDEAFAIAWTDAVDHSTEALEAEGIRRALQTSDLLLMFFLKARRPHIYRENAQIWRAEITEEQLAIIADVWRDSVAMAGLNREQQDRLREEFSRRLERREERLAAS